MGVVLSQRQEDGQLHPFMFMSKSFTGAKINHDTHDKELLVIIRALEEWQFQLEGTEIPISVHRVQKLGVLAGVMELQSTACPMALSTGKLLIQNCVPSREAIWQAQCPIMKG